MFALFGRISPAQAKVVLSSRDKTTNKPVKVTRVLPDPNVSPLGHSLLALLFYGCFIAYIVVAIREYIDQPPTTIITQVDSDDYSVVPAFNVRLGVECKVDGSAANGADSCGDMLLNVNYSGYPLSPCYESGTIVVTSENNAQIQNIALANGGAFNIKLSPHGTSSSSSSSSSSRYFYNVPLCYTAQEPLNLGSLYGSDNLPISMIHVGFLGLNETGVLGAQMSVEVSSVSSSSSSSSSVASVSRTINVNSDNSVRLVPISGVVERGLKNEVISFTPSAEVIQFEGFRSKTSSAPHRSDVIIALQSKTTLRKREQVKSLWDLVSNIGSAFETLMGFMPFLLPFWGMLFFAKSNWLSRFVSDKFDTDKKKAPSSIVTTASGGVSSSKKYEQQEEEDCCSSSSVNNNKDKNVKLPRDDSSKTLDESASNDSSPPLMMMNRTENDDASPVKSVVVLERVEFKKKKKKMNQQPQHHKIYYYNFFFFFLFI